ncbi:prenyltransferase/squalene oxidase repeat-containing protein [Spirillospora sp. NPDC047279]|uniref:prenyltransferase/squalene oxidase repeat-containing protein n=1 Tax=Spirillospora sp. NPDC047279 TaxID=3155478 RepID=UPI0033E76991
MTAAPQASAAHAQHGGTTASRHRGTAHAPHAHRPPGPPATGAASTGAGAATDVAALVAELIAGLVAVPWGQVSPSVYETGRLVTHTPWLTGHGRRVAYLLATQRPDGGWGLPDDGYALVPSLSAIEALLSVLSRRSEHADAAQDTANADGAAQDTGRRERRGRPVRMVGRTTDPTDAVLASAADRGLRFVARTLSTFAPDGTGTTGTGTGPGGGPAQAQAPAPLPDMPAIELIVPALLEMIERRLADLSGLDLPGADAWRGTRLPRPAGHSETKLALVRGLVASGADMPKKLLHALEIAADEARGLPHIRTEPTGTIGASPAATAAWLGDRPPAELSSPARWHLETVAAQHDGLVPVGYPLTVFERGWVLSWLIRANIPVNAPPELILSLTAPLGPAGTPAAAGLPTDADTTAGALYALALLGAPHRPDPLFAYEKDTHFCTWQGEEGFSTTTNAHVLEAFGQYLAQVDEARIGAAQAHRYAAVARKVSAWLLTQQLPDGSWVDRWHASPYYATACCALALERFGGPEAAEAVARARRWVLDTQRPDGSWGRWQATPEETAYAVQILLSGPPLADERPAAHAIQAAFRAREFLEASLLPAEASPTFAGERPWSRSHSDDPALWHDKDVYHPKAIVRAAVLAAVHLMRAEPHISGK